MSVIKESPFLVFSVLIQINSFLRASVLEVYCQTDSVFTWCAALRCIVRVFCCCCCCFRNSREETKHSLPIKLKHNHFPPHIHLKDAAYVKLRVCFQKSWMRVTEFVFLDVPFSIQRVPGQISESSSHCWLCFTRLQQLVCSLLSAWLSWPEVFLFFGRMFICQL